MSQGRARTRLVRHQQVFTASGTWNPFATPTLVDVLLVGGGGGGGFAQATPGGGGAGGQVTEVKDYLLVGPLTITVGAGGGPGVVGVDTLVAPGLASNFLGVNADTVYAYGGAAGLNANGPTPYATNGITRSAFGGPAHVRNPHDGGVFGTDLLVKNFVQPVFLTQGFNPTSGYPYGAGGGGGSSGSATNTYRVGAGFYGAGAGGSAASPTGVSATANSGGGGGGGGCVVDGTAVNLGGSGGSGIIIFAWND